MNDKIEHSVLNKEAWKKSNDHFPFVVLGFDEKFNIHILYKWKRSELSLESLQKVLRLLAPASPVEDDYVHSEQMLYDFSRANSLTTNQILTIDYEILVKKDGKNYLGFEPDYDVTEQTVVQEDSCQDSDQADVNKTNQYLYRIREESLRALANQYSYDADTWCELKWSNMDFNANTISIPHTIPSQRKALTEEIQSLLQKWKRFLTTRQKKQVYVFMNIKRSKGEFKRWDKAHMQRCLKNSSK